MAENDIEKVRTVFAGISAGNVRLATQDDQIEAVCATQSL
jgi:hypothetical protein